jgi:uncharacterized protein YndB with AHSA1/START domain
MSFIMMTLESTITVETSVKAKVEKVWQCWTTPADIKVWNNPSNNWHNTLVKVDLQEGGNFLFKMGSKDGSEGFDYAGKYNKIVVHKLIELTTNDNRKAVNTFTEIGDETIITETFTVDESVPVQLQKEFCQNILDRFKKYVEGMKE